MSSENLPSVLHLKKSILSHLPQKTVVQYLGRGTNTQEDLDSIKSYLSRDHPAIMGTVNAPLSNLLGISVYWSSSCQAIQYEHGEWKESFT